MTSVKHLLATLALAALGGCGHGASAWLVESAIGASNDTSERHSFFNSLLTQTLTAQPSESPALAMPYDTKEFESLYTAVTASLRRFSHAGLAWGQISQQEVAWFGRRS